MKIENIHRPRGAHRPAKRVGRGSGSGHGKTSCRGSKGAKSRSGATRRLGFEGGQMSLIRRIPKRGFTNAAKKVWQVVNVERLNHFRKDSSVDRKALEEAGFIKNARIPVKILGSGKISKSLNISVDAYSESARKKIEEAGGKTNVREAAHKAKTRDIAK